MLARKQLEQIAAGLARLGARRLALLGLVGTAVMLAVGISTYYLSRPPMQPIYTGLSAQDVTRMTAALAEAGVAFDVNEQRSAVLVPFGQAARARSLLAQKGLPTSARAGYELFDQMGSMGLTSFMQEVTRVRALEGEIARTIQTLDGVAAARVHLVLPEAGSFRRDKRDPSASVLLRIDGRWQAPAGQAVRHIVAAAVPGMKIEQVSVASTDGRLIAAGGDERGQGSLKLAEMERAMAAELESRAGRTLASAIGIGNYQVSITVRLDIDRQQINETVFDPKSRVERSVRVVKQSGSSEDGGSKPMVGVEANVPRAEAGQTDGDKRRQREDRREELVNYELNSKSMQTVREGYRVQRLAIAAVVNKRQVAAQLGAGADQAAIDARLAELKRLIQAATGAELDQNSSIEISAADFGEGDGRLVPVAAPSFLEHVLTHLGAIVNALALLGVAAIAAGLGLRPLAKALGRPAETAGPTALPKPEDAPKGPSTPGVRPTPGLDPPAAPPAAMAIGAAQTPAQSPDAALRRRLEALVVADEVRVANVLKSWMAEERRA
jgi:flagellar M-ring protein FliF